MVTPFEQSILDGQISYWLNAKLTIDGDLELRSTNHLILPQDNDAVTPTLAFGDGDTGLYEYTDDVIRVSINGSPKLQINATQISSVDTSVWALLRKTATHIIPNIVPREDDLNTGVGHAEPDALSLIAGGVEGHRITEAAGLITHVLTGDVSVTGDVSAPNLTSKYGEMYIYNNSNSTVIETADTPIALRQISEGLNSGFIFHAGSTGEIVGLSDYSGTVAGTVKAYDSSHGLSTGDIITIRGTTNYNGIHEITVIDSTYFYFTAVWAADQAPCTWDKGASLTAQPGADGVYTSTWQMTTAPAGACELCFKVNINETPQNKSTACRDMAINDKDNNSSTCLMDIVEGDIIWLSVQSDATSDITNSMGNMNLERM